MLPIPPRREPKTGNKYGSDGIRYCRPPFLMPRWIYYTMCVILCGEQLIPKSVWHPIPVSKLVKDQGVRADNMPSPSAQCTEAANKARRLIFMIRRSFQDLSKSAFIPLYGSLVCPHPEYGMPVCSPNLVADINHLVRIQR